MDDACRGTCELQAVRRLREVAARGRRKSRGSWESGDTTVLLMVATWGLATLQSDRFGRWVAPGAGPARDVLGRVARMLAGS